LPLRDRFRGHRAIVMGNGPGLVATDWSLVRGEATLGTNRIYLLRDTMGFDPDMYCCVDGLVLEQFYAEISALPSLKLLDWRIGGRFLRADRRTVFLPEIPDFAFHGDLLGGWNHGYTVTFAALQAAFYLGFDRVILIGVDHRFRVKGPPTREVTSHEPDRDHFVPDYFGRGVRWHLPHLAGSERAYATARAAYLRAGREILDATEGGALRIFPRMSLQEALTLPGPEKAGDLLRAAIQAEG